MDIVQAIKVLQDPMGVPFFPIVFIILMVLTFAIHIIFVNFVVGSSIFAIYGALKGEGHWARLSKSLVKATPITNSVAILIGIAPLLFYQVVYDPFWYVSNTLSAWWVLGFLLFLMIGYFAAYIFYLKGESSPGLGKLAGIVTVVMFFLVAFTMHNLNYQALLPEKWFSWYIKGLEVDTSGSSLHAFQLPRLLHFLVPAFAMIGIYFMLYAWYFSKREDFSPDYLNWVGTLGAKLALYASLIQALVGFWWLFSVPAKFSFHTNPFFLLAFLSALVLLAFLFKAQRDPAKNAIPAFILAFITVLLMASAREALRVLYFAEVKYSPFDYKVNLDLGSTALFFVTFLMGLVIIGYQVAVAFLSGRSTKILEETPGLNKWGKISIALLLLWLIVVAGLGIIITFKNYIL